MREAREKEGRDCGGEVKRESGWGGVKADGKSATEREEEGERGGICGGSRSALELKGLRLNSHTQAQPHPRSPSNGRCGWPVKHPSPEHCRGSVDQKRPSRGENRSAENRESLEMGLRLLNGVAASLPPGQLKDRAYPLDPFSGDRGLKEPRRGPPSPEPSVGGTPPLKPRRHSDTDKPKGKRPCKTKHTSQREREREKRKEATPNSPGQRCVADLGAAEDDKVSADTGVWMFCSSLFQYACRRL
ncbi:BCL-6 corepressor isoform X1 [Lates japonicus]|uniref:BCL-6 corepressor isoform X1 n=1 Tax=Lates japonicus TaxID=270547 RepID=A0AAD3R0X9_LATJO|nr:BCL-6 corepressor isoform X1 [Lates japonicus]